MICKIITPDGVLIGWTVHRARVPDDFVERGQIEDFFAGASGSVISGRRGTVSRLSRSVCREGRRLVRWEELRAL
ncbi:MAG: hypothetical protein WKF84_00540 [Pyrinomonadaceae bacterium]